MLGKGPESGNQKPTHPQENKDLVSALEAMRAAKRAEAEAAQKAKLDKLEEVSGEHGVVKPEDRYTR